MKTITKFFTIAAIAASSLFGSKVKAQSLTPPDKFRFGIGAETGVTTGSLHDMSKITLGGTARLQYGLNENFALTLTSGYLNAFGKKINAGVSDDKYQSFGIVPVQLGVKAYGGDGFYLGGEAGVAFETKYNKDAKVALTPSVGYSFTNVDVSLHYQYFAGQDNNYGIFGVRVAYGFKL